jgi:hypothetical protein
VGLGEGGLQRVDRETAALDEETQQAVPQEVELPYVVGTLPDRHDAGVADHLAQRLQVIQGRLRVQRVSRDGILGDPIREALLISHGHYSNLWLRHRGYETSCCAPGDLSLRP